jgi:uncharacterized membrane protein
MEKSRLEAFSDGVIAIILTIMVLDLKVPKEPTLDALSNAWPVYFAYTLSYGNVFFVWLNHHDIFASLKEVDRPLLLWNGLLLFFASLVPFVTAFASESHWTAPLPVSLYGVVMVAVSLVFLRLRMTAKRHVRNEQDAVHHSEEARISLFFAAASLVGALCGWFMPKLALLLYAAAPLTRGLFWSLSHQRR